MENLPFDPPHTIYMNILRNLKGLSGLDDIYYAASINKVLWDQRVYHTFNKIDEDSKHSIVAKGLVVAMQPKFSKTNLKAIKVVMEQTLKEAPQVDLDAINKRKQKMQAKAITYEDKVSIDLGLPKRFKGSQAKPMKYNGKGFRKP